MEPLLELRQVSLVGRDRHHRLQPLSLQLRPGERVALLGPSGAGKSSLLAVANGLLPPSTGTVLWQGVPAGRGRRRQRQQACIGTLWQDLRLVEDLTVQQNLNAGRLATWSWPRVLLNLLVPLETDACRQVLARVELDPGLLAVPVTALSGGQRQRVALGRLLRQGALLLLADEPLAQLDPPLASRLLQLLLQLGAAPRGLLMSLHHPDLLEGFDRVLGLRQGRLVLDTTPAAVTADQWAALYATGQER
jgi:phosphonate transport system ATP-binding protein